LDFHRVNPFYCSNVTEFLFIDWLWGVVGVYKRTDIGWVNSRIINIWKYRVTGDPEAGEELRAGSVIVSGG